MSTPCRPTGPVTAALDASATLEREAAQIDLDSLDQAMLARVAGAAEAMQGESLDALRRRMVRLGMETLE